METKLTTNSSKRKSELIDCDIKITVSGSTNSITEDNADFVWLVTNNNHSSDL